MVIRIVLTLALVGTVLFGGGYYRAAVANQALHKDLDVSRNQLNTLAQSLDTATAENKRLQADLSAMDVDLGGTKTRLTAAESAKVHLGRELRSARENLAASESETTTLTATIRQLEVELATVNSRETSPAKVAEYQSKIEMLEQALAESRSAVTSAPVVSAPPTPAAGLLLSTNRARTSSVMSIGPSNAFVVINYGAVHGALPTQVISIRRGTETIATALISDVREKFSIAQVQPESLRGALHKGDSAVIAQ